MFQLDPVTALVALIVIAALIDKGNNS